MPDRPIEILLVEDSLGDERLMKEALKSSRVPHRIAVARDGEQAIAYLRKRPGYSDAVRPDVILLDLNLPGKDGREVLADIKNDADLKTIPVAVLTTSNAHRDIVKAYTLHANCYINKPMELEQFTNVVRAFEEFWLRTVTLPPPDADAYSSEQL
jgi:CheY-like chemotaxis protein